MKSVAIIISTILMALTRLAASEDSWKGHVLKAPGTPADPKVRIVWDRYYDSEALEGMSKQIADAYPDLAKFECIGRSGRGRDLWCLTVTDFKKGKPDSKPGTYIQGNIHGNEIPGGETAIYTAWYLTENFATIKAIADLLADKVFYIVPTVNPDSRDLAIHRSGSLARGSPDLAESLGRDIDGDGYITQERVKDLYGIWRIDPLNPEYMVRMDGDDVVKGADGAERAKQAGTDHYDLAIEGGFGPNGMLAEHHWSWNDDPNRDWGWSWDTTPALSRGRLKPPFSFTETRAIRDFLLKHDNIAAAFSLHTSGGEIFRGTASKVGATDADIPSDTSIFAEVAKHGERILGYKFVTPDGPGGGFGREIDWMYAKRGVYSYIVEQWEENLGFKCENSASDEGNVKDRSNYNRTFLFGDGFVPWHKVNDPAAGEAEVGGWKEQVPEGYPGFLLEAYAHRTMAFVLNTASETAKLDVELVSVEDEAAGLRQITATIRNNGLMPTHSGPDIKWHITRPDYLTLQTSGEVVAAQQIKLNSQNDGPSVADHEPVAERIEIPNIPGYSTIVVRWRVKGGKDEAVRVDSVKGGKASKEIVDSTREP